MTIMWIILLIGAYLLGSILSAVIVAKGFRLPDPRTHGSRNPGASNIFRLGGKFPAALVLFFDVAKGAIPVSIAVGFDLSGWQIGLIGLAACFGHIFPIYYRNQGGKGVATALGCLLPLVVVSKGWIILSLIVAVWLGVFIALGYASLASICAAIIAPLVTHVFNPNYTLTVSLFALIIVIRHHANIARLLNGTEPRTKSYRR